MRTVVPNADGKYSREDMLGVAARLKAILAPYCHRIEIAGSLRRERPLVSDIELVVIPKYAEQNTLAGIERVQLLDDFILNNKSFRRRPGANGKTAYGPLNKLLLFEGVPVDIFTADSLNFCMVYFIRTGGQKNNVLIATRARQRGYQLKIYDGGFYHAASDYLTIMTNERNIYEFVGETYRDPAARE